MLRRLRLAWCIFSFVAALCAAPAPAAELDAQRTALYNAYQQQLDELAQICDRENLPEQASITRQWLPPRATDQLTLFVVNDGPDAADLPETADKKQQQWRAKFLQLRAAQADALFALAEKAVAERRLSLAMMLLTEAVRENPDHARARAALGYERFRDAWVTPFGREMREKGNVWDDRWGWIPAADRDRYAAGQRPLGSRWVDEAEEAQLRRNIARGWQVRTDHYQVTTNHSLQEGVRLAKQLEDFYQIWRQVFAAYCFTPAELQRALAGRTPRLPAVRPHSVVYYRERDEYNRALRREQPRIDMTLGIYFDTKQRAYFFAGEDQSAGTLYHEAAHQLFQETRRTARNVGRQNNFWIIEGIAAYLESLTAQDGYFTLGGRDAGRLPAARQRLLDDGFYVPLAELTRLGMAEVQSHPEIAKLYSQAAGQAAFLLHGQDGAYREALVAYLIQVYQGQATPDTLADETGQSYEQLDKQYREFLTRPDAP